MQSKELIDYLALSGFSVYPDANFIPADADNKLEAKYPLLFVMGSGGFAPHSYVPTERPTYQIVIKGKSYKTLPANMATTEAYAKELITHLHRRPNYLVGSAYVFSSLAVQSNPIPLGLDNLDRPMFSTNFVFHVREM